MPDSRTDFVNLPLTWADLGQLVGGERVIIEVPTVNASSDGPTDKTVVMVRPPKTPEASRSDDVVLTLTLRDDGRINVWQREGRVGAEFARILRQIADGFESNNVRRVD